MASRDGLPRAPQKGTLTSLNREKYLPCGWLLRLQSSRVRQEHDCNSVTGRRNQSDVQPCGKSHVQRSRHMQSHTSCSCCHIWQLSLLQPTGHMREMHHAVPQMYSDAANMMSPRMVSRLAANLPASSVSPTTAAARSSCCISSSSRRVALQQDKDRALIKGWRGRWVRLARLAWFAEECTRCTVHSHGAGSGIILATHTLTQGSRNSSPTAASETP